MAKQSLTTIKEWFEDGMNPTGSQFSDTFDSFLHLDESFDLTTPGTSGIIATQEYVSNLIDGLDYKQEAFCSSTANLTLSGVQNLDGTTGSADVRVLVQHQTDQTENGIYLMNSGAWERSSDANTGLELEWAVVQVANGTLYGDKVFRCGVSNISLGSTNILWSEWALASYTAGDGLSLTGNQFSVDATVLRTSGDQSISGIKTFTDGTNHVQLKFLRFGGNPTVPADYLTAISTPIVNRLDLGAGFSQGIYCYSMRSTNFEVSNISGTGGSNQLNFIHGNSNSGIMIKKNTVLNQSISAYYLRIGSSEWLSCSSNAIVDIIVVTTEIRNITGTIEVNIFNANPIQTSMNTGGVLYGFRGQVSAGFASGGGTAYNLYLDGTAPSYIKAKLTCDDDIEITDNSKGLVLKSPDGTRWRIEVDNSGVLSANSI